MKTKIALFALTGLIGASLIYGWTFITNKPLDEVVVYATAKRYAVWMRWAAEARLLNIKECPNGQFGPATPLSFLVAAMEVKGADREEAEQVFLRFQSLGCDINAPEATGLTPLHVAVLFRDAGAVAFLLQHGADPEAKIVGKSKHSGSSVREFARLVCDQGKQPCDALNAALGVSAGMQPDKKGK